jgi:hypothetical protein
MTTRIMVAHCRSIAIAGNANFTTAAVKTGWGLFGLKASTVFGRDQICGAVVVEIWRSARTDTHGLDERRLPRRSSLCVRGRNGS